MSLILTTFLHSLCISISVAILALSIVNFGLLLTWINSIGATLAFVYHVVVLITSKLHAARAKKAWNRRSSLSSLSMKVPQDPPPPYDRHHRSSSIAHTNDSGDILKSIPSGPFYSDSSLFSIVILIIITIIGFIMTIDVLLRGVSNLPPGERANGATFHLDMNIQEAQCTLMGVLILLLVVVLALCVRGRNRIAQAEEEEKDEFQVGYTSRESIEIPVPVWNKATV